MTRCIRILHYSCLTKIISNPCLFDLLGISTKEHAPFIWTIFDSFNLYLSGEKKEQKPIATIKKETPQKMGNRRYDSHMWVTNYTEYELPAVENDMQWKVVKIKRQTSSIATRVWNWRRCLHWYSMSLFGQIIAQHFEFNKAISEQGKFNSWERISFE